MADDAPAHLCEICRLQIGCGADRVNTNFETRIDEEHVVWLSGELDVAAADQFASAAASALNGQHELVVDLSALTFLDSEGIRVIIGTAKMTDRGVVLRESHGSVRKVLDLTAIAGHHGIRLED